MSDRVVGPAAHRLARWPCGATPKAPSETRPQADRGRQDPNANPTTYLAGKAVVSACSCSSASCCWSPAAQSRERHPDHARRLSPVVRAARLLPVAEDPKAARRTWSRRCPTCSTCWRSRVEAGLGFDAAVVKVCERMKGRSVEEFRIVLHEMRIGESRSEALKNLADRTRMNETTTFARSIVQADQLGISLGRILRVQGQDMRHRRQMAAEERAMKAPVKMLFPIVVFIFPAMFVVILGPAALNLMQTFSGGK